MRVPFASGLENRGEGVALPLRDGFFVAFAGASTRLLRRPLQPRVQEAPDMVVVQRDTEVPANQISNTLGGPEFIGPTVGLRSLAEQQFEFLLLLDRQARRGAAMAFRGEAVRLFCE